MQQPNECFFCGRICDRTICKRCADTMDAADPLTRKEMGLVAAAFKVITAPLVIDVGVSQRVKLARNPGMYSACKCGKPKKKRAKVCRECRAASKYHPCPELLTTGQRCGNRAIVGRERCSYCERSWSKFGHARGVGVATGPREFPVDPGRLTEAKACAAALMASLKSRTGVEVRL